MNNKIKEILLIITLAFAFSEYLGDSLTRISDSITYSCLLFWIVAAVIKYVVTKKSSCLNTEKNIVMNVLLKENVKIRVIIYVYTLILIFLGITENRFFSTNIQTFINGCSAGAIIYIFGKKALKYSSVALVLAYIGAVSISIVKQTYFFEFHDLAYGVGFLIIYYAFQKNKYTAEEFLVFLMAIIATILAAKRIAILGLLVVLLLNFALKSTKVKNREKLIKRAMVGTVLIIYGFVLLVSFGGFWNLVIFDNTDFTAGRSAYYKVFYDLTNFSPTFLGLGRNAMNVIFKEDYYWFKVANIHSDILRMYAECGFWIFGLWLAYFFIKIPNKVRSVFGYRAYEGYAMCTIYLFITYLTDNTELYKVTQYFYILVVVFMAFDSIKNEKITVDELQSRYVRNKNKRKIKFRR
ncbi:hypothetical protein G5B24_10735 [Blautia glucerasea]|uniref:hypothetical protein n=1 Tax=Clostridia TaxID=186801 RepID=UPI00156FB18E|nr:MULTISPECIES: hypothetical protein [Clostridia]NSD38666.1 hypothetical protein [Blautia glucerasea]